LAIAPLEFVDGSLVQIMQRLRKQYGGVRFRVHGRRTVPRPFAATVVARSEMRL
jgi:hypothetical protein